jgi:hypothetical protein
MTASRTVADSASFPGSSGSRIIAAVTPRRADDTVRAACRGVIPGRR